MEINNHDKLPGDYIAGFVDGEGCFYLTYRSETKRNRSSSPVYFRWTPYFAITLRRDDVEILTKIQTTLGCGNIYIAKNNQAQFFIQNINDLYNKVAPFFKTYPLRAKKRGDFELWCEALTYIYEKKIKNERYSQADNKKLTDIRIRMRVYKAELSHEYKNTPL